MKTADSESLVRYELDGEIARVTLDDGKVNVLSPRMVEELSAAMDRVEAEAKAVVLTGRPGCFSAGFDLRVLMSGMEAARALFTAGGDLLLRLYEFPRPLVIACTGHALAAGVLLVATGDTRLGARVPCKIGLNEVEKGIPIPTLAAEFARDCLDPRELTAAVVQSRIYDAEAAASAGWLDSAVDEAELLEVSMAEARRLARLPGAAYAASKHCLRRDTVARIRNGIAAEMPQPEPGS